MSKTILTALMLTLLLAGALPAQDSTATLTAEQTQLNLESFDHVWSTIHDRHFDTTFGGLDWQAVRDELRPKVETATTMPEAREPFFEMISRLGLSHFSVIPATLYENIDREVAEGDRGGKPGLTVCVVDSTALVETVIPGGPADLAGVKPGWIITEAQGDTIAPLFGPLYQEFAESPRLELYLTRAVSSRLSGAIGDTVTAVFIDGEDRRQVKQIKLAEPAGKRVLFGNLPPFYLRTKIDTLEQGIGYFGFSCFFEPMQLMGAFNMMMTNLKDAPGLIIDIRNNGGGIGALAIGITNWLVSEQNLYLGTLTTRDSELKLVVNPRAFPYKGAVAVLVNGNSASSSEFLAGGLQDIGRARIFGTRTVGAALPSVVERLPNGDGFQYAFGNYVSASGRSLEGEGVIPDEEVKPTRAALLAGRDLALEAAVKWIEMQNGE